MAKLNWAKSPPYRTGTASNLLKECVQAKISETRSMVGGRHPGKSAAATENRAQRALDVPVQDMAEKTLLGLSAGLCGTLMAVGGMVTRQARPSSGAGDSGSWPRVSSGPSGG